MASALWPLSVDKNFTMSPDAIFTKAGANTIVPPSVPLLRSLTSTSAARTVPTIVKLAATVKMTNFFTSRPFWMDFLELPGVRNVDILPPGESLSQRNVPAGSLDISGFNIVACCRGG